MDQNSLFNKDTRIFALDDSPFSRGDEFACIIGVVVRKDLYIESIVKGLIRVDGLDATDKVAQMIEERGEGIRIIMTQGVTFGGFNILDVKYLFERYEIPIVNVVDHRPDMVAIKRALQKYFEDWEIRYSKLKDGFKEFGPIYIQSIGIEPETANKFLIQVTRGGTFPEPLRIADLVASIC